MHTKLGDFNFSVFIFLPKERLKFTLFQNYINIDLYTHINTKSLVGLI